VQVLTACDADGEFKASAIAEFVSANKLPLVITLTQETAPSIFDNPIKKQACHVVYNGISFKHTLNIFKEVVKSLTMDF
jgi:protein disulfide-isomerase A1